MIFYIRYKRWPNSTKACFKTKFWKFSLYFDKENPVNWSCPFCLHLNGLAEKLLCWRKWLFDKKKQMANCCGLYKKYMKPKQWKSFMALTLGIIIIVHSANYNKVDWVTLHPYSQMGRLLAVWILSELVVCMTWMCWLLDSLLVVAV